MISIVVPYHNRKPQLVMMLKSIEKQLPDHPDTEVVAVDGRSQPENRIEDLVEEFPFLKVIRLDLKEFRNPCYSYNVGFSHASGDKVIIQSPECVHAGKVLDYVSEHLTEQNYLSFGCYSADRAMSDRFIMLMAHSSYFEDAELLVKSSPQSGEFYRRENVWFNHSKLCPRNLHFTTAITKKNLDELQGFDERYALGMDYDDDEFLTRVTRLGLSVEPVDHPCSVHIWHDNAFSDVIIDGVYYPPQRLAHNNRIIFVNNTSRETTWRAPSNEHYNSNGN